MQVYGHIAENSSNYIATMMHVYGHIAENLSNWRKSQRYPTPHGAVQRVFIHVYLDRRAAPECSRRKFYVHHAVLKCENGTDVTIKGTWHAD